ncbi:hypothetical protein MHLP_02115 [Candidatus Mycoplasma haematolamae str. Purdue]|uniref:Uncharacterized protein n=1 Tax=Mycoplasma haematolamae (strain Purdue) TaxID=1212765 RepID=I7BJH3_MYCHA|nr:hypothetical protein [Candidatus Mycoplasma haematolamae]AFO52003.1 hypothetical protein MHLP_02115 [Candidatus Mycoplasma haematolamae str. Purdue]
MTFLSVKAIAALIAGAGGIGGGGYYGVTKLVKAFSESQKLSSSTDQYVKESESSRVSADLLGSQSQDNKAASTEVSASKDLAVSKAETVSEQSVWTLVIDKGQQGPSEDLHDEEDEDDRPAVTLGLLALVEGDKDSVDSAFKIKTYQQGQELGSSALVSGIPFTSSAENLERKIQHFNLGFLGFFTELKEYLGELKEKESDFKKIFVGSTYEDLVSEISKKIGEL